ncbi:hypothetical protein FO519_005242 [Halicephalobus sp. NKZ332]|nr:hypothetical protein FO519_005242 [Halicephalobus sp. NKZ332]
MANNNTNLYFTDSEYSDSQGSYSYPYSDHYDGTFEHSVQGQYQMYHNPQQFQQGLHQDFKPCRRKRMYTDKERHKRKLESARRSREKRTELDKLVLAHVEAKELIYMRIKNLKRNVEDGLSDLRRRTRH